MTKADLVERIQAGTDLSKKESIEALDMVLLIMKETLEVGENLKISGFGSFLVKQKRDRKGRNPQTGETITIDARRILTFKPSSIHRNRINEEKDSES